MRDTLPKLLSCSESAINRMFDNPDIDTARLVKLSYLFNCDFIRNIYMPYMVVDEHETIANDCISDTCTFKIMPNAISIITDKQTRIYQII